MTRRPLFTTLRIIGAFLLAALVSIIIIFAYGYSFDWASFSLAKKGVILFGDATSADEVFVDGRQAGLDRDTELRLLPGPHTLTLLKKGFKPWMKTVVVSDTQVVSLNRPYFFPEDRNMLQRHVLDDLHIWKAVAASANRIVFHAPALHAIKVISLNDDPPLKELFDVDMPNIQAAFSNELFLGIDQNGALFSFHARSNKYRVSQTRLHLLMGGGDHIYGVDTDGNLFEVNPEDLTAKVVLRRFLKSKTGTVRFVDFVSDHAIFLVNDTAKKFAIAIDGRGGVDWYLDNASAVFEESDYLYFAKKNQLIAYDKRLKEMVRKTSIDSEEISYLSHIEDTESFLMVKGNHFWICDIDNQNCHEVEEVRDHTVFASEASARVLIHSAKDNAYVIYDLATPGIIQRVIDRLKMEIF